MSYLLHYRFNIDYNVAKNNLVLFYCKLLMSYRITVSTSLIFIYTMKCLIETHTLYIIHYYH